MNRTVLIIAGIVVIAVVGIVVWQVALPADTTPAVSTITPAPQKFDMSGGQEMRPHWQRQEGEGNEAEN